MIGRKRSYSAQVEIPSSSSPVSSPAEHKPLMEDTTRKKAKVALKLSMSKGKRPGTGRSKKNLDEKDDDFVPDSAASGDAENDLDDLA